MSCSSQCPPSSFGIDQLGRLDPEGGSDALNMTSVAWFVGVYELTHPLSPDAQASSEAGQRPVSPVHHITDLLLVRREWWGIAPRLDVFAFMSVPVTTLAKPNYIENMFVAVPVVVMSFR